MAPHVMLSSEAGSGQKTNEQKELPSLIMKPISTLAATLGAALLIAGSPVLASAADNQAGPIRVDNVQLLSRNLGDYSVAPIGAEFQFTNQSSVPATNVVFALTSDSGFVLDRYTDVGTFSHGVNIRYEIPDDNNAEQGQRVAVAQATFADGTVWTNPDLAPAPAPAADSAGVGVVSYLNDY
jgi:hypothetical protein